MMGRFGKKGRYSCFIVLAVLVLLLPYAMARGFSSSPSFFSACTWAREQLCLFLLPTSTTQQPILSVLKSPGSEKKVKLALETFGSFLKNIDPVLKSFNRIGMGCVRLVDRSRGRQGLMSQERGTGGREREREVYKDSPDETLKSLFWIGANYHHPIDLTDTTGLNWKYQVAGERPSLIQDTARPRVRITTFNRRELVCAPPQTESYHPPRCVSQSLRGRGES
ncbi:hypothetical protein PO909_007932 [Leuciscus waleckii]